MQNKLVIFGYGYVAEHLCAALSHESNGEWIVQATSRSTNHTRHLQRNVELIPCGKEALAKAIKDATHLVLTAPPNEHGDPCYQDFSDMIANAKNLRWIGYLSATSVYGDHEGGVVGEDSALLAQTPRGKLRILAEKQWQDFACKYDIKLNIFRLAGIYGPGRSALEKLQNPNAVSMVKQGHKFSRIHVEDIASILKLAMKKESSFDIFNLADDRPSSSAEVDQYAAQQLGLHAPKIVEVSDAEIASNPNSFFRENKIVSNHKVKEKLGACLKYPSAMSYYNASVKGK